jgi:TonB family protein
MIEDKGSDYCYLSSLTSASSRTQPSWLNIQRGQSLLPLVVICFFDHLYSCAAYAQIFRHDSMKKILIIKFLIISLFFNFSCTIKYNPSVTEELKPRIIHYVEPEYPQEALDQKIEGTVVANIHVDLKGKVVAIEIIESVHPLLDHAFYVAAKEWKYDPMDLTRIKTIVVESYFFYIIDVRYMQ